MWRWNYFAIRDSRIRDLADVEYGQAKYVGRKAITLPEVCNFIKKESLAQVFSCELCKLSKNTFFTEQLWTTALVYCKERKTPQAQY